MNTIPASQCGARDFDFLHGSWAVQHHRLKDRLAGCTEWESFDGRADTRPILGGMGNMDDNTLNLPGDSYRAVTLRTYDPVADQWSIWWLDGRNPGVLDTPTRGRFHNGRGEFFANDLFRGRPIRVRFIWSDIAQTTCRWEQAFSADDGQNWEVNWVMTCTRLAD